MIIFNGGKFSLERIVFMIFSVLIIGWKLSSYWLFGGVLEVVLLIEDDDSMGEYGDGMVLFVV